MRLLESWRESVARGRPKAQIDPYMRNMTAAVQAAGGDMAKAALDAGLVDKLADRQAFETAAGAAWRRGRRQRHRRLQADQASRLCRRQRWTISRTGPIGVVTIAGMIVDGKAPAGTAGGDTHRRS